MYKINVYRDFDETRRQSRFRTVRTALLAGLITIQALLVGGLGLSALLLEEQASGMRAEIARMQKAAPKESAELDLARELLNVRKGRIDWSPKLAALASGITPSLTITQVSGQSTQKGRAPRLSMSGVARDPSAEMLSVSSFVENLRDDSRIAQDLPQIRLGTIRGAGSGEFEVVCEGREKAQ